jgi:HD-GYP domain-containing protein (c-di-GMP phosphodiesterase class II)
VSVSLARRLGLSAGVAAGLDEVYERFDGRGGPAGLRGEQVCLAARITHLADIAGIAHLEGGEDAARTAVAVRRGGHFDPAVADAFAGCADEVLAGSPPTTCSRPRSTRSPRPAPCSRAATSSASRRRSATSPT